MPRASKNPVLRALRRLRADVTIARARGVPVDALAEARARERERAWAAGKDPSALSRRKVLAGAGAAALGALLPRAARASDPQIAIVGGGMAGMACALALADAGIASTVYESQHRIGGRMFSNTDHWGDGMVSEWCGELIDSSNATLLGLADRFALSVDDLIGAEPPGSEDTYFFGGRYYPKTQLDRDMAPVFAAATADLEACGSPVTHDHHTAASVALDMTSVHDWIEARVPGGHASPLGKLLDVAYAAEYGADSTRLSALNLLILLGYQPGVTEGSEERKGAEPSAPEFAALGVSDGRYRIRGGNQLLPQTIASYLGERAVRMGHALRAIEKTAAGRYRLAFDVGSAAVDVVADHVVLALPFAVLRVVDFRKAGFSALKETAIFEQGRGRNSKVQLQFSRRFWNGRGAWPGVSNGNSYSDTGYQWTWDVSRAQAGLTGILNCYSGGAVSDAMLAKTAYSTDESRLVAADAAIALARLEPVFPGASALWTGRATQSLPDKSPHFGASYSYYEVGQYTTICGVEKVSEGGVLFCGEHTSVEFQGFMEGAAAEGWRAGLELRKLIQGE